MFCGCEKEKKKNSDLPKQFSRCNRCLCDFANTIIQFAWMLNAQTSSSKENRFTKWSCALLHSQKRNSSSWKNHLQCIDIEHGILNSGIVNRLLCICIPERRMIRICQHLRMVENVDINHWNIFSIWHWKIFLSLPSWCNLRAYIFMAGIRTLHIHLTNLTFPFCRRSFISMR